MQKYKEIIKYLIFGGLTTLVSILSYYLFTRIFSLNYQISNILSWILSVTFAFITNKKYVFESKSNEILKELFSFYSFRIASLLIEMLVMYLLVLFIDDLISKLIAQILVIILNYIFSKLFVFGR